MKITVRHAEPEDYEAVHRVFRGPRAVAGTLQLPFPSRELWRKRLAEPAEGHYQLVACVDGEVVGELTLWASNRPRKRHVGGFGMAVRDDRQGLGVGTALLRAALDLADNWIGLTRVELHVYTDNAAAVALYKKFGFEVEGNHRRYALRDGEYVDSYSMARLKE
jgi:L-phenylalanine/L-methionine N-acetyltransferase